MLLSCFGQRSKMVVKTQNEQYAGNTLPLNRDHNQDRPRPLFNNTGHIPHTPSYLSEQNSPLYSPPQSNHSDNVYSTMEDITGTDIPKNGIADEENKKLREDIEKLKEELEDSKATISRLKEKEKAMRDRLSEQAIRHLETSSKFEDLNLGCNRPTQLIRRYGNLYTETRLDAFDALDELPEMSDFDELKGKLLFSVIVLAFRSVQNTMHTLKAKMTKLLYFPQPWSPLTGSMNGSRRPSVDLDPAVKNVQDSLSVYLRKTVEKQDVRSNVTEVCEQVWTTLYDYPSLRHCRNLRDYIEQAVRLAWALTAQTPSYVLQYEGQTFDEEKHERFHSSDPEATVIKHILWPVLLEGTDGPCVYKGVVIT